MRISRHRRRKPTVSDKVRARINEYIKADEVRVVDAEGEYVGIMTLPEALTIAREQELDLVEINPAAVPPVCKIMLYGQYKYQQEKQERTRRAKQKEVLLKGIRLSARIGDHDLEIRKNQAVSFLQKGNNVKIEIILRGREKGHTDIARNVVRDFIAAIQAECGAKVEQPVMQQGPRITSIITPQAGAKPAQSGENKEEDELDELE